MVLAPGPTDIDVYLQTQKQYSRKELFNRVGAGYAETLNMLEPGVGIPTPLTAAESADQGFMVFQVEFFGGYPDGTILRNGIWNLQLTSAGLLINNLPLGQNITYDMTPDIPPNGIHTIGIHSGIFFGGTTIVNTVFIDGKQIGVGGSGSTVWSSVGGVWEYMNTFTNIGFFSPVLEIFPGYRPAIVVG